jgi:hypothetical protein
MPGPEDLDIRNGEVVIRKGVANHFVGAVADGGTLTLTDSRLIFRAHAINYPRVSRDWQLHDLQDVTVAGRNQLVLTFADGSVERFPIWHRRKWVEQVTAARNVVQ